MTLTLETGGEDTAKTYTKQNWTTRVSECVGFNVPLDT